MLAKCRAHLNEAGETYFEHLRFATLVGLLAIGAGLACVLHAVVPALCQRTCSRTIGELQRLFADRSRLGSISRDREGVLVFVGLCLLSFAATGALLVAVGASPIVLAISALAIGMPAAFLWSNPELEGTSQLAER